MNPDVFVAECGAVARHWQEVICQGRKYDDLQKKIYVYQNNYIFNSSVFFSISRFVVFEGLSVTSASFLLSWFENSLFFNTFFGSFSWYRWSISYFKLLLDTAAARYSNGFDDRFSISIAV